MAEAGLSNMDMELTKYLIGLFKSYYPNFLNYIIIFEMPWVLNAAFRIIKSWLPAKAIPKIKFINKSTLKDYVNPNDAMKCWGGNNDYIFKFVSEEQTNGDGVLNGKLDNKKVHILHISFCVIAITVTYETNNNKILLSLMTYQMAAFLTCMNGSSL